MTARLRVRETYVVIDGTELIAVEVLTAEGNSCGHLEVPVLEWNAFIEAAAKPWPFHLLDRAPCGGCGHEAHLDEPCGSALFEPGAYTALTFCQCGVTEPAHAEVIETGSHLRLLDDEKSRDIADDDRADYEACMRAEAAL